MKTLILKLFYKGHYILFNDVKNLRLFLYVVPQVMLITMYIQLNGTWFNNKLLNLKIFIKFFINILKYIIIYIFFLKLFCSLIDIFLQSQYYYNLNDLISTVLPEGSGNDNKPMDPVR